MKYKLPKLYKGKEWFIEYAVQHPETGEWWPKKERAGLNKKSLTNKQRSENAKDAIAALTELLKQGQLNPWAEEHAGPHVIEPTITEAITIALEKKNLTLGSRSQGDYKTTKKYFIECLQELSKDSIPVSKFTRRHFIDTLDYMAVKYKCSPHRINMHQQYLSALMSIVVDMEYIDINPLLRLKKRKEPEPTTFEPPTDAEQLRIDKYLFDHHRALFVYKSLIYVTGARPFELLEIKVKDVDFENGDIELTKTKPGKRKTIPLTEDLILLLKYHAASAGPNDWLFAKHEYSALLLMPGPVKITNRNTASRLWREIVIEGLGIEKKMYAQKHKGTDDKILAGIPLEYLQEIYGHSSSRMTKKYETKLKSKAMEEIKKKSPGIIPK